MFSSQEVSTGQKNCRVNKKFQEEAPMLMYSYPSFARPVSTIASAAQADHQLVVFSMLWCKMHLFCAKTKVVLPICRMMSSFMCRWKWFQLFHLKIYHARQHLLVQKMSMQIGWNHENENRNLMQIGWNHEKKGEKDQEVKMENQIPSPRDNKNWKEHRTKCTRSITPSGESGQGHSPVRLSLPRLETLAAWPPTSIARRRRKHRRAPSLPWLGKDVCFSAASNVIL